MSNTVTNTPAANAAPVAQPVIAEFKGHKVVDNKVQPILGRLYGLASGESTLVPALQTEWDTKVEGEKKVAKEAEAKKQADAKKVEDEANATPTWKFVLFFIPFYGPRLLLSGIASLVGTICAALGYGAEKTAEKPADKPAAPAPTAAPKAAEPAKTAAAK